MLAVRLRLQPPTPKNEKKLDFFAICNNVNVDRYTCKYRQGVSMYPEAEKSGNRSGVSRYPVRSKFWTNYTCHAKYPNPEAPPGPRRLDSSPLEQDARLKVRRVRKLVEGRDARDAVRGTQLGHVPRERDVRPRIEGHHVDHHGAARLR